MKRFLKKVNRGLVLGAVVLAGFIIFVVCDTNSFKKTKPQISTMVEEYLSEMETIAVTPGNLQNFDSKSKDDAAEIENSINGIMSKYWTVEKNTESDFYDGAAREDFKSMLMYQFDNHDFDNSGIGYVTKWSAHPTNIDIHKSGPGYAEVEFDCEIVAEFAGNPFLVTPGYVLPVLDMNYGEAEYSEKLSKITVNGEYAFTLKKQDDKWEIIYADWYGWDSSISSADEGMEGIDE
ncbi:MAG: hypothetical protein ACI4I9_08445 [Porcipelethomonas sp.]